jgi:hypothetical protein
MRCRTPTPEIPSLVSGVGSAFRGAVSEGAWPAGDLAVRGLRPKRQARARLWIFASRPERGDEEGGPDAEFCVGADSLLCQI